MEYDLKAQWVKKLHHGFTRKDLHAIHEVMHTAFVKLLSNSHQICAHKMI